MINKAATPEELNCIFKINKEVVFVIIEWAVWEIS